MNILIAKANEQLIQSLCPSKKIEFNEVESIEFESLPGKEAQQIETFGADLQNDKIFI